MVILCRTFCYILLFISIIIFVGDPSADILPVSGFLQFITEATEQSFVLSVLPDTLPELDEVCV